MRRIMAGGSARGWVVTVLLAGLLTGCHADTAQGGAQERGSAGTSSPKQNPPRQGAGTTPTPPTADQVDPSSPRAVIDGTSTTQPTEQTPRQQQPSSHQQSTAPH